MTTPAKSSLSPTIRALIVAGAGTLAILSQFLDEKEGTSLKAYRDGVGIWTICKGHTGPEVKPGMVVTKEQCDKFFASDIGRSFEGVDRLLVGPVPPVSLVGITSFCTYNIGEGKCSSSTFRKLWNAGDRIGACKQIPLWIKDGGKDCRIRSNNCFGQVERRQQEEELCLMGLEEGK